MNDKDDVATGRNWRYVLKHETKAPAKSAVVHGVAVSDASKPLLRAHAALCCPRCSSARVTVEPAEESSYHMREGVRVVELAVYCHDCTTWTDLVFNTWVNLAQTWVTTDPRRWRPMKP